MQLYDLAAEYRVILEHISDSVDESGELMGDSVDAWLSRLDRLSSDFDSIAEAKAVYVKELTAEASALATEIQRLQSRKRACEGTIRHIKDSLLTCMSAADKPKIETAKARVSIRTNPESVTIDKPELFIEWAQCNDRDELLRYSTPQINKSAVKNALNAGESISGARLTRTQTVTIK
ncbi:MAG: siphovirus Gp157 family protein [Clostridia bacterium]|nr:siphovirus Gp157 family protein [Clostridia bacterium]